MKEMKMQSGDGKRELAKMLQAKIDTMQGLGKLSIGQDRIDLAPFASAFPNGIFPSTAIHEFISYEPCEAAATCGFITALAGRLMKEGGLFLWIGPERKAFPGGLKPFGLDPDRIVFITLPKPKDALWMMEEALKCEALTGVIGEIRELGFTESRRLQLAVERSGITGIIHRHQPFSEHALACTTRWKVTPLPSQAHDGLPGIGHSCWNVELLKVRNGRPDAWQVTWAANRFDLLAAARPILSLSHERHTG